MMKQHGYPGGFPGILQSEIGRMKHKYYDSYCSVCGYAITTNQIGACIDCEAIDFTTHGFADLSIHVCTECWVKIITIAKGGMKKAIKRNKELKRIDAK
jgi:hypothetical protein